MKQERRGLRFLFDATAEVTPEGSPNKKVVATVTELSLYGCYIETSTPFAVDDLVFVKIFYADAYFEAKARVVHAKEESGMGVSFREVQPYCRSVLQRWILLAMRNQTSELKQP
jgi:PilZ domain